MSRGFVITPAALRDLESIVDYLTDEAGHDAVLRFRSAATHAFGQLLEQPELGAAAHWSPSRLLGCRRWRVSKPFDSYQVFYRATDTRLEVLRVLHGAREMEGIFEADE